MAGQVRAAGQVVPKPATQVDDAIELKVDPGPRFVSRGGEKLAAALDSFAIDPRGAVCADVGASTGGFTDCLLQRGARLIYAIDVGHGILHWKLRNDPRVVVMERTNARYLAELPEPIDLVTMDASFISLRLLLPVGVRWMSREGSMAVLVKPQFEAGRRQVARGRGVVRDPRVHAEVLRDIIDFAAGEGLTLRGAVRSPIKGPKGNVEFLLWLDASGAPQPDLQALITALTGLDAPPRR